MCFVYIYMKLIFCFVMKKHASSRSVLCRTPRSLASRNTRRAAAAAEQHPPHMVMSDV